MTVVTACHRVMASHLNLHSEIVTVSGPEMLTEKTNFVAAKKYHTD